MQRNLTLIKYNFDKVAATYQDHSFLQKKVAKHISSLLYFHHKKGLILDLGSGPGTLSPQEQRIFKPINFDISLKMLQAGKYRPSVNGTATNLPFANNSFTTIISNLMLQWPDNKIEVFKEIKRVLQPNGIILFTTLINNSLFEVKNAWKGIDDEAHILNFLEKENYLTICQQLGLKILKTANWHQIFNFASINGLYQHFKLTGTSLPKSNSNVGLGGRKKLNLFAKNYASHKTQQGLPLTYNLLLIVAIKEG